MSVENYAIAT